MEHGNFFSQPMPSNMGHQFSLVPQAEIERSTFDRSFTYKTTFNSGLLIPFFLDEVIPGDTFDVDAHFLARLATPQKPIMDNMYLSTFFFFVPYRLIHDHFVNMMGEQENPGDPIDYAEPVIDITNDGYTGVGTLWDFFGFPITSEIITHFHVSAYPFRAHNLIYNRWFRDENLEDSVTVKKDDTSDDITLYDLYRRGKRHDYFTSCLPFPQKGPDVSIPLSGNAPVLFNDGTGHFNKTYMEVDHVVGPVGSTPSTDISFNVANSDLTSVTYGAAGAIDQVTLRYKGDPAAEADMTAVTAATINTWRLAFQTQKLLERSARGGTRFPELLAAQFGVTSPDFRFQWPEYLGGGKSNVMVTPVPQTAPASGGSTNQGNLAAVGAVVAQNGHGFTHSFTEHGLVLGYLCVDADLTYSQGVERIWRGGRTRYDFYTPAFAHLGEQAVLSREIYADGTSGDGSIFGYQEAWAEYRYKPSRITGKMRPQASGTLAVWNLCQDFGTRPALNSDFIKSHPPIERVVFVDSEPQFILDSWIKFRCTRPMPTYSVPGLIDHF